MGKRHGASKLMATPLKIWICNCKNGDTTLGQYINGKRRVFFTIRRKSEVADFAAAVDLLKNEWLRLGRDLALDGDPSPALHAELSRLGVLATAK